MSCCIIGLFFSNWATGTFSQVAFSQEVHLPEGSGLATEEKTEDASRQLVRIGVLARGGAADCAIRYKATADYLTDKIDGYRFVVVPIYPDDFMAAVSRDKIDFTLCSALLYAKLQAKGEVSSIATMQGDFQGTPFSQYGGVVFCRSDRNDIKSIRDMAGKSFAAVAEDTLSWIANADFLRSQGFSPQEDASDFEFLGTNAEVVHAVSNGTCDVGAIGTGTLERMAKAETIKISDYRIFNVSSSTEGFPFVASTSLYPEWAFAKTNFVSEELAGKVATALYEMSKNSTPTRRGRYAGWIVPANYQPVWECFEKTQGPSISQSEVAASVFEAWGCFLMAIFILIFGVGYIASLKRKLRISNSVIDQQIEDVVLNEKTIRDLKRRITAIAGEEHEDMNIIRHDYKIEYLTPEWEEKYGPGVGELCYKYFSNREEPCPVCGLREAFKVDHASSIEKSFPREAGRPLRVTTIPLANGKKDGAKLFGQVYCDVLTKNRMAVLSSLSQERETRYLLLRGAVRQSQGSPEDSARVLWEMSHLTDEAAASEKVDLNTLVQQVASMTEHLWGPVAELSFDLSDENPTAWAADLDMRIVVANLILHAVSCLKCGMYSTNHKGVITLSTQVQGDSVFLVVMDNGNGQNLMDLKELTAEPGRHEDSREDFIKVGLWPTYARVFEKWNNKFRVNCPDEHRMIRTVAVPVVAESLLVTSDTGDAESFSL